MVSEFLRVWTILLLHDSADKLRSAGNQTQRLVFVSMSTLKRSRLFTSDFLTTESIH